MDRHSKEEAVVSRTVEYQVRAEEVEVVERAVRKFLDAIAREEPGTVYEAFQRPEQSSFIHFMVFPDGEAEQRHRDAAYTHRFVEVLYPRCESPPRFTEVRSMRG